MAIVYDKLFALLKEKGYTTYRIRKEGLLGNATYTALKSPTGGRGLDHRTIDKLCKALQCQPGDLMEYVPDPVEEKQITLYLTLLIHLLKPYL